MFAVFSDVYGQNEEDRRDSATVKKITNYEPNSNYRDVKLRGYTIRVNKLLMRGHYDLYKRAMDVMDHQLFKIERVLPAEAVRKIQQVVIWLEYKEPHHPCAAYHPGRQWLVDNGMNPDKVKCVEISNAQNFVDWTIAQPYMVLHEMAHAYHDQALFKGFKNPGVLEAYQDAMKAGQYEKVLGGNGREVKHYSTTNQMEYFAEATEAYFGTNDYYPFIRPELEIFDAAGARAVEAAWGLMKEK
ncbi:MAG: hypothetical protein CMJ76_17395 [Planctomycetaceae bacterium]|nr:hypothetical protein [Planctomycetaceae bacterium]|tara:strand:- start:1413 stop:2141 length:729 start_codon:yes stop_codon:yes gene_type:complete